MIRGIVLVFIGACSFGVLSTFVKFAYADGFTLGDVTGVQVLFGLLTLWVLFFIRGVFTKRKIDFSLKSAWKSILVGTSTGLVSVTYYKCVSELPASIAILLLMQFTWISLLLELVLYKKVPTRNQLLAVILIIFGTLLAGNVFGGESFPWSWEGIGFGMMAAFFYAVFIWANGRVGNALLPVQKSAYMMLGACTLIFILFTPEFLWDGDLQNGLWQWGIILALFGTVLPPLLYAYGIPKAGVGVSAIVSSAELPVAVFVSSWLLAEKVVWLQWIGVVLILAAILLSNLKRAKA